MSKSWKTANGGVGADIHRYLGLAYEAIENLPKAIAAYKTSIGDYERSRSSYPVADRAAFFRTALVRQSYWGLIRTTAKLAVKTKGEKGNRCRNPWAKIPHCRKASNSSLTKLGKPAPVSRSTWAKKVSTYDLGKEGLDVFLYESVQRGLFGTPSFVGCMRTEWSRLDRCRGARGHHLRARGSSCSCFRLRNTFVLCQRRPTAVLIFVTHSVEYEKEEGTEEGQEGQSHAWVRQVHHSTTSRCRHNS